MSYMRPLTMETTSALVGRGVVDVLSYGFEQLTLVKYLIFSAIVSAFAYTALHHSHAKHRPDFFVGHEEDDAPRPLPHPVG